MKTITLPRPDDWHVHLRDGDYLKTTVPATAKRFARAVVMPNLKPPITSAALAAEYRSRVLAAIPKSYNFTPLFALYLTDNTTPEIVKEAKNSEFVIGFKLYPAGATTNSAAGVTELEKIYPALEAMQKYDVPLLIHGEVTDKNVDVFAREKYFLEQQLTTLVRDFPQLRIVLEHITTAAAVAWIKAAPKTVAATMTAHHLLLNRNDLLVGGIHPHLYCLPILKKQTDQAALIAAATSGNPKFFLGTDSAPHAKSQKESSCGCAGIYTAHAAIELYAEVFEQANALNKLADFASGFGADFYQLPRNQATITLEKQTWQVPLSINYGSDQLIPFRANAEIHWKLQDHD